ncbi:hypothetical protein 015DV002_199 [Bacillus phage 015DV002]|nr:hypothetical protein 000TH008_208 [Bacillus phage 000TH008]QQO41153.1 hypothetical protein 015DV002_199 [Bacillus phage 015DV002]QQO41430.1 hypothetical protein 015DV004_215 [Bacillus phage 015DV004]
MYVIMIIAVVLYTLILSLGFVSAAIENKKDKSYIKDVMHIIHEIKDIIHKEE